MRRRFNIIFSPIWAALMVNGIAQQWGIVNEAEYFAAHNQTMNDYLLLFLLVHTRFVFNKRSDQFRLREVEKSSSLKNTIIITTRIIKNNSHFKRAFNTWNDKPLTKVHGQTSCDKHRLRNRSEEQNTKSFNYWMGKVCPRQCRFVCYASNSFAPRRKHSCFVATIRHKKVEIHKPEK